MIAWKQRNEIISMERSAGVSSSMAKENKLAKTMALVNGLLYLSWTPFVMLTFVQLGMDDETLNTQWMGHIYYNFTHVLVANSLLNPLIYAARDKDFKNAFKRLLRLKAHGNGVTNLNSNSQPTASSERNAPELVPPFSSKKEAWK
ncbi:unnamed protein product [Owenia fusiformis]|uniref:Uncharacterized protein n=1 Tax=Owenia fusiformis TaxID=6347 RepID=A0A8J1U8X6_OWEFU|nr:unnamed protein product [Owenia fusiformis]